MKRLAYNAKRYIKIVLSNVRFAFLNETAYWSNNWGNLISTVFYTLSFYLLVNVLYSNTSSIAGYSYDELLFLFFIGQIMFYLLATLGLNGLDQLIWFVNQGTMDYYLVRPFPSLLLISSQYVRIGDLFYTGIPSISILVLIINWANISVSMINLVIGSLVLFLGLINLYSFYLTVAAQVFKTGEAFQQLNTAYRFASNRMVALTPLESFKQIKFWQLFLLLPQLVGIHVATSVMLGKMTGQLLINTLVLSLGITIINIIFAYRAYKNGLKNYTSASS